MAYALSPNKLCSHHLCRVNVKFIEALFIYWVYNRSMNNFQTFIVCFYNQTSLMLEYVSTDQAVRDYGTLYGPESLSKLRSDAIAFQSVVKDSAQIVVFVEEWGHGGFAWNEETPETWLQHVIDSSEAEADRLIKEQN